MNTRSYSLLLAGALALPAAAQSVDHAKQLFDRAKFAESKSEFLAVQKANDRSASAAYYLGRLATFDNDGEEAIRQLELAVKLEGGNALYHFWLGCAVRDEAPRASMFSQLSMVKHMRDEFLRAVELDANQLDARLGLVQFYAGAPEVVGGSMDKAREQFAELAKRDALRGAMARATIASVAKDTAAEAAAYKQAIASAPDSSAAYFALGFVYVRDGKGAEAFATLDAYEKRRKNDPWSLYQAGRFAGISGQQLDRGEAGLKKFLAAPPSDAHVVYIANAHYWTGRIAERRGAKEAAREQYVAALKLNPKYVAAQKALDALK